MTPSPPMRTSFISGSTPSVLSVSCLIGEPRWLRLWKRLLLAAVAPAPPSTTSGWMVTPRLCVKDVDSAGRGCLPCDQVSFDYYRDTFD